MYYRRKQLHWKIKIFHTVTSGTTAHCFNKADQCDRAEHNGEDDKNWNTRPN
jgi:hypothetical protein